LMNDRLRAVVLASVSEPGAADCAAAPTEIIDNASKPATRALSALLESIGASETGLICDS
jgi:hypothetical protein